MNAMRNAMRNCRGVRGSVFLNVTCSSKSMLEICEGEKREGLKNQMDFFLIFLIRKKVTLESKTAQC